MYEKKNENENIGQFLILEFFLTYIQSNFKNLMFSIRIVTKRDLVIFLTIV